MNEYAIFCELELMLVVDAEDEKQARAKAAGARFDEWDCFPAERKLHVELRGPSEEQSEEYDTLEQERRYHETEVERS